MYVLTIILVTVQHVTKVLIVGLTSVSASTIILVTVQPVTRVLVVGCIF